MFYALNKSVLLYPSRNMSHVLVRMGQFDGCAAYEYHCVDAISKPLTHAEAEEQAGERNARQAKECQMPKFVYFVKELKHLADM